MSSRTHVSSFEPEAAVKSLVEATRVVVMEQRTLRNSLYAGSISAYELINHINRTMAKLATVETAMGPKAVIRSL